MKRFSKYEAFWYTLRPQLWNMINDNSIHIDVGGIQMLGSRNNWSGSVIVNGQVIGIMAHAVSLGRVLKEMLPEGKEVKAIISNKCVLRMETLAVN